MLRLPKCIEIRRVRRQQHPSALGVEQLDAWINTSLIVKQFYMYVDPYTEDLIIQRWKPKGVKTEECLNEPPTPVFYI